MLKFKPKDLENLNPILTYWQEEIVNEMQKVFDEWAKDKVILNRERFIEAFKSLDKVTDPEWLWRELLKD